MALIARCRSIRAGVLLVGLAAALHAGQAVAIVGGKSVAIESAPWTVAILLRGPSAGAVRCTGVIVDATHVVTAAHCLSPGQSRLSPDRFIVRAGVSDAYASRRGDVRQQRAVVSFRMHPDVRSADIAVLVLSRPLNLDGRTAKAIPLVRANTWRAGTALLSGFGQEDAAGAATGALKQVAERVDRQGTCGSLDLGSPGAALWLCASSAVGGGCYGDSGAGLVSTGPHPVLIGILSAVGIGCHLGKRDEYMYVGAPEMWRFVLGDDHPPLAPQRFELELSAIPTRVGNPIFCDGTGAGLARTRYTLSRDGHPFRTGSRPITYTIRATDIGKRFSCQGSAVNAGGDSVQEWSSSIVKP